MSCLTSFSEVPAPLRACALIATEPIVMNGSKSLIVWRLSNSFCTDSNVMQVTTRYVCTRYYVTKTGDTRAVVGRKIGIGADEVKGLARIISTLAPRISANLQKSEKHS